MLDITLGTIRIHAFPFEYHQLQAQNTVHLRFQLLDSQLKPISLHSWLYSFHSNIYWKEDSPCIQQLVSLKEETNAHQQWNWSCEVWIDSHLEESMIISTIQRYRRRILINLIRIEKNARLQKQKKYLKGVVSWRDMLNPLWEMFQSCRIREIIQFTDYLQY